MTASACNRKIVTTAVAASVAAAAKAASEPSFAVIVPDYLSLRLDRSDQGTAGTRAWVHASSVGEVQAITPLIETLLERGEQVFFTSFTASRASSGPMVKLSPMGRTRRSTPPFPYRAMSEKSAVSPVI